MEQYDLYSSPTMIAGSDSEESDDESYHLYQDMQKIPNVPMPSSKQKPKKLFQRVSNSNKLQNLRKLLVQLHHPLVASTPLNKSLHDVGSDLNLSPIRKIRNSIVSQHFVNSGRRLSEKDRHSADNNNSITQGTKHLNGVKKLNKKTHKRMTNVQSSMDDSLPLDGLDSEHCLDGIEPLNNTVMNNTLCLPELPTMRAKETQTDSFDKPNQAKRRTDVNMEPVVLLPKKYISSDDINNECGSEVLRNLQSNSPPRKVANFAENLLKTLDTAVRDSSTGLINNYITKNIKSQSDANSLPIKNNSETERSIDKNVTTKKNSAIVPKTHSLSDRVLRSVTKSMANTFSQTKSCITEVDKENLGTTIKTKSKQDETIATRTRRTRVTKDVTSFSCNVSSHQKLRRRSKSIEPLRDATNINLKTFAKSKTQKSKRRKTNTTLSDINNVPDDSNVPVFTVNESITSNVTDYKSVEELEVSKCSRQRPSRRSKSLELFSNASSVIDKNLMTAETSNKLSNINKKQNSKQGRPKKQTTLSDINNIPDDSNVPVFTINESITSNITGYQSAEELEITKCSRQRPSRRSKSFELLSNATSVIDKDLKTVEKLDNINKRRESKREKTNKQRGVITNIPDDSNICNEIELTVQESVTSNITNNKSTEFSHRSRIRGTQILEESNNASSAINNMADNGLDVLCEVQNFVPAIESAGKREINAKLPDLTRSLENEIPEAIPEYIEVIPSAIAHEINDEAIPACNNNNTETKVSDKNKSHDLKEMHGKRLQSQTVMTTVETNSDNSNEVGSETKYVERKRGRKPSKTRENRIDSNIKKQKHRKTTISHIYAGDMENTNTNYRKTEGPAIILEQYILSRTSGFVKIDEASNSSERNGSILSNRSKSNGSVWGDGRLRRTIQQPKIFIQSAFCGQSGLKRNSNKKKSSDNTDIKVKWSKPKKYTQTVADNDNTTHTSNMDEIPSCSTTSTNNENSVLNTLESSSNTCVNIEEDKTNPGLPVEDCFKKPIGKPKKTNAKLRSTVNNKKKSSTDSLNDNSTKEIPKTLEITDNTLAGSSKSGLSALSKENDSIIIPPSRQLDVRSDSTFTTNSNCFSDNGITMDVCATKVNKVHTLINNQSVAIDWVGDPPIINETEDFSIKYCLTDLRSHLCLSSCGYIVFGPKERRSHVAKTHSLLFKIEKGRASVWQQFISTVMEVGTVFYVPLGSSYTIENPSTTEPLILFFHKTKHFQH